MSMTPETEARVGELLAEYRIPSASVGILHHGDIARFAFGTADAASGRMASVDTIYQIGSMTKTWTTLALMGFVDEGRIDLDAPVRDHLPAFAVRDPDVGARVTPRHLLNHTNGIEEDFGDPGEDTDVLRRMVANIADAPQVQPLGHLHGYSGALGYAILGRVMEVVEGRAWDDILTDRVIRPIGATSTSSGHHPVDPDRAATGHVLRSLAEGPIASPLPHLPRAFGPGGNVTSTTGDVLAMAHVLLNDGRTADGTSIASPQAIAEMKRSRVPLPDPYTYGPQWALGLIVCDWNGHTVYASDGSTVGHHSRLRILPDHDLAVVMLTNCTPRESFYRKVFNAILGELGAPVVADLPAPDPNLAVDPSRYAGVYERPGTRLEVLPDNGRLQLIYTPDPAQAAFLGKPPRIRYELLPVGGDHFLMPPSDELDDTRAVSFADFSGGAARYLHTNSRLHPRRP
ncbi:MAG TPA: serine hydrolase domain-containing protein [Stackebrandtia sp.]|jgi:CubicO group peptidase (beta-lactamase class C family)|uniref:serine hydrolase domain-containing protein n=1 Tax=Stackebrandtia sp. TaxID=2023065 RepID=UPI002D472191|nr:serine hydrolase domain-containing protein [Stackebrandtia sp.]HZE41386.1 serine hydrolase domain-containing protein [Stackebrandtia sp.]